MFAAVPRPSNPFLSSPRADSPAAHPANRTARFRFDTVSDDALHANVKTLTGRHNTLTAELLAHLAEVDARGIYRERACSSLYAYCLYELRLSEDEAQRRVRAARTARAFPLLFEMLADGAIHLTGLLLLAPYLTLENHAELLARARFRTKRELERLVAELAPRPDVPARIEPLGPERATPRSTWQAFTASLRGPVRELAPGTGAGQVPPSDARIGSSANDAELDALATGDGNAAGPAPARVDAASGHVAAPPLVPARYRVEFTASQQYVELLDEARDLLQHQVPDRDVAKVHELAMAAFVTELRARRAAATRRSQRAADASAPAGESAPSIEPAPARVASSPSDKRDAPNRRYVPAEVRRAVWERDGGCCTFEDATGRRCAERAGLEVHHEHAFALGGPATLENLRLLCRAHNGLLAERDFGRAHVQACVQRMRNARPELRGLR